jgi:hypothetical protein
MATTPTISPRSTSPAIPTEAAVATADTQPTARLSSQSTSRPTSPLSGRSSTGQAAPGRSARPQAATAASASTPQAALQQSGSAAGVAAAGQALSIRSTQAAAQPDQSPAVRRFGEIVASNDTMNAANPEVKKAAVFQGVNVGAGAGFAFGLGRSLGASAADMITRAAFEAPQLAGVGADGANFQKQTDRETALMMTTAISRWVGAAIGGGIGAAVGNVVAPRLASTAGRQLLPVAPNDLVPDHVANLLKPDGQPYGQEGVAALRAGIAATQKEHGNIAGGTHVRAGEIAFGAENALRGAGQGLQPMGLPVDVAISTIVSATSGAATGATAAFDMARQRVEVPDARHTGSGPAPMINVPPFRIGDPAPIPDRFTANTKVETAKNMALGTGDRTLQMAKASGPLGAAGLTGTAIAAALPETEGDYAHRLIQMGVLGAGVAAAVEPWFQSQPRIAGRDAERLAQQRSRDVEMTPQGGTQAQTPVDDSAHQAGSDTSTSPSR